MRYVVGALFMENIDKGIVPKAELHCHIEGAANPQLVTFQALKYDVDISKIIHNGAFVWSNFAEFLKCYDGAASLFRSHDDYALLSETYLSELALNGCIYSEVFISTDHARMVGISEEEYVEGLAAGMRQAKQKHDIESRMIATGLRHEGPESVIRAATYIANNPHPLVTGFGMGGEERMYSPRDFIEGFEIAREAGLAITSHAGELVGPESIQDTLKYLKPHRIGHGVRAIEDKRLVSELAEKEIVLECCPGSNIALGLYPTFQDHPFVPLRDSGVLVTLNSDDPPHFDTSLANEYRLAEFEFGLSRNELVEITKTAINAAFVDQKTRISLLEKIENI